MNDIGNGRTMKVTDILGENRFDSFSKVREASRAIIIKDGMILLTYEDNGQYFIPGGGFEADETPVQCCIREAEEETGLIVSPFRHFLTINEYYEEWKFVSHYFECRIESETGRISLTERELSAGVRPVWIDIDEAVSIFAKHDEYRADEMKRGAYLREYTALLELLGK